MTKVTYKELLGRVSQFANALKSQGVKCGDRVIIYMPMTIEGVVAMQACARIGAIHSVVFGGFSPESLIGRILTVDTTDMEFRVFNLKPNPDNEVTYANRDRIEIKELDGLCAPGLAP